MEKFKIFEVNRSCKGGKSRGIKPVEREKKKCISAPNFSPRVLDERSKVPPGCKKREEARTKVGRDEG